MLDRKGRDVGKFPLQFNDKITLPISVFDYDNNKNYRICITLLMSFLCLIQKEYLSTDLCQKTRPNNY